jgi:hypothetical protein
VGAAVSFRLRSIVVVASACVVTATRIVPGTCVTGFIHLNVACVARLARAACISRRRHVSIALGRPRSIPIQPNV